MAVAKKMTMPIHASSSGTVTGIFSAYWFRGLTDGWIGSKAHFDFKREWLLATDTCHLLVLELIYGAFDQSGRHQDAICLDDFPKLKCISEPS